MTYLWIFLGCYALTFIYVNLKITERRERAKASLREIGMLDEALFNASLRASASRGQELLIRIWAPFVYSILPTGALSLGYLVFS